MSFYLRCGNGTMGTIVLYFNNAAERSSVHQDCLAIKIENMVNRKKEEHLCERELLERILHIVEKYESSPSHVLSSPKRIYDNKSLMEALGIKDKFLKKLRDNGFLGYSRKGDKYWYTQEDVDRFLRRYHYEAFAVDNVLPE